MIVITNTLTVIAGARRSLPSWSAGKDDTHDDDEKPAATTRR